MKVISVNVSLPKEISIDGRSVATGIFKEPRSGPVIVRTLNLDQDGQADLSVHGGPDKAVYIYPSEHYEPWQRELQEDSFGWGTFGENLSVEGLFENDISIGDELEIGTARFQVTQPRLPCFKLAAKLERPDIIQRMLDNRRTGFYVRVLQEGQLQAGDPVTLTARESHHVTVRDIVDLYLDKKPTPARIRHVLSVEPLSKAWRDHFQSILART